MPAPSIHGFSEKVALVINGAEGIGRAVAMQLALQGCFVICSYQQATDETRSSLDELRSLGTLASSFEFVDERKIIDEVDNLFGRLDLLVNCVKTEDDSVSNIELMTRASLRLMEFRPKGLIVNVISGGQTVHFVEDLPAHFRQNCVITVPVKPVVEHGLFLSGNYKDIARVVLFFLSNESNALNRQVLSVS